MTREDDDRERVRPYLARTVEEAWARCLPVWSEQGRVNDFPRGTRRTRYLPSFATRLGHGFAERFADAGEFLLGRLQAGSELEAICAFDLLDFLAQQAAPDAPLPDWLGQCALPLPERVRREIESDWIFKNRGLDTVGKLLNYDHPGHEAHDA